MSPNFSSRCCFSVKILGLICLGLLVFLVGCSTPAPPRADKTPQVNVTIPIVDEVLDYQDFTGRLEAFRTVDIRSRVQGYVESASFKEGDLVKKGDVLFKIDSRLFKAELVKAEGNLKVALADRDLQKSTAARARRLLSSRAIGQEEFDVISADREKSSSNVVALQAARDYAALYLEFTKVTSPISGRISRRFIDPGNLVKADDTIMTTVVADEPIYAYFDVDERTYLDLAGDKPSASANSTLADLKLPVLMRLSNEDEFTHPGKVDFLDNRLSGNTGTIRLRAVFSNPGGVLKSGLFARIRLPIGTFYKALLIPAEAIQSDQGRKFVYVVDADNNVEYRSVKIGQAIHSMRVIKSGLKEGEQIVVSGMQRVRPSIQVKVNRISPPKRPDFPLGKLIHRAVQNHPDLNPRKIRSSGSE